MRPPSRRTKVDCKVLPASGSTLEPTLRRRILKKQHARTRVCELGKSLTNPPFFNRQKRRAP